MTVLQKAGLTTVSSSRGGEAFSRGDLSSNARLPRRNDEEREQRSNLAHVPETFRLLHPQKARVRNDVKPPRLPRRHDAKERGAE